MNQVLNYFGFPKESLVHEKVQLKDILNQLDLKVLDKKTLSNAIQSIYLEALLDKDTTRILEFIDEVYRYESILVLGIILKDNKNFNYINEKIHQAFQNPVIAVYEYSNTYYISCSIKRQNKQDSDKTVIDEIITTDNFTQEEVMRPFFDDLSIERLKVRDLKHLIDILSIKLINEQLIKMISYYPKEKRNVQNIRNIIKEYNTISIMVKQLEDQYKRESMMSRKMDIYIEVQEKRSRLKEIESKLKEENINGQN